MRTGGFEYADALHAHEKALRAIQVNDAESLCAYLKGFWEFIYNYKMFKKCLTAYMTSITITLKFTARTVLFLRGSPLWKEIS